MGIATFEGLELNPEGGRLFYDVLDGSGPEVTNTAGPVCITHRRRARPLKLRLP